MEAINESPTVSNLRKWCLFRLHHSEEEIKKAREYQLSGFRAIGNGLRELREDAGIYLEKLAEKMGISVSHLSLIEDGDEWTEGLINLYVDSLGKIYLKKEG